MPAVVTARQVVRERILAAQELLLKTQRRAMAVGETQVERDLEMAAAILRRTGRQLREALPHMDATGQQNIQRRIAAACRELDRMAEPLGKKSADGNLARVHEELLAGGAERLIRP